METLDRKAKKIFFESLRAALTAEMQKTLAAVNACDIDDEWIDAAFDEVLHNFMQNAFDYDYENSEDGGEFYQLYGCDTRCEFEREARGKMDQYSSQSGADLA